MKKYLVGKAKCVAAWFAAHPMTLAVHVNVKFNGLAIGAHSASSISIEQCFVTQTSTELLARDGAISLRKRFQVNS